MCLQDFEILKCIGKGGFAKVFQGKSLSDGSAAEGDWADLCDEGDRESKDHQDQEDTTGVSGAQHYVTTRLALPRQDILRLSVGKTLSHC